MQKEIDLKKEQDKIMKRRRMLGWFLNKTNSPLSARISYLSVFIFSILFSVFYLQSFFYLISILLISLPFLSYYITSYAVKKLTVSLELKPDLLRISIDNPTFFPVSCADITLELYSLFYGGNESETHSLSLKSKGTTSLDFPIALRKYGIYEGRARDLVIYDPLHIFVFKKDTDISRSVTVIPETTGKLKDLKIEYEEGFDEFTDTGRKGNASSNVTDIREYRPGDRLSRIHWKLTEKLDTLIVKENEATSSNDFTVLLELYQPSKAECLEKPSLLNTLNNAIEEAYAVSEELISAGEPFIFMFYNEKAADFVQARINSKDDLNEALIRAYYAGCYHTKDLALSVYNRSGQEKGTLIHVN